MCTIGIEFLSYNVTGGLAWDWVNQKLYWADSCDDDIEVYDPTTGHRRVLFHTGTGTDNRDIIVDPTHGWVEICKSSAFSIAVLSYGRMTKGVVVVWDTMHLTCMRLNYFYRCYAKLTKKFKDINLYQIY